MSWMLSPTTDKEHWLHTHDIFFIPVRALSVLFRAKFLALLNDAFLLKKLKCNGRIKLLAGKKKFNTLMDKLYNIAWNVNCRKPFKKPEMALEYLSRYVNRVALSNRRIVKVEQGKVTFVWKDYRSLRTRQMTLEVNEFIRRFFAPHPPTGIL